MNLKEDTQVFGLFSQIKSSIDSLSQESRRQNDAIIRLQETVKHMEDRVDDLRYTLINGYTRTEDYKSVKNTVEKHADYFTWITRVILGTVIAALLALVIK